MKYVEKLVWYLNRLRCMSLAEIINRLKTKIISMGFKYKILSANKIPEISYDAKQSSWLCESISTNADMYVEYSVCILNGKLSIFNMTDIETGVPPNWNMDYKTGVTAPLVFGATLDYRDESLVGNIKYLWEPNRHIHLVCLARAYYLNGDKKYLDALYQQLNSWLEQCPYLLGPNWTSSLELAIRLINWSFIWQWVGGMNSHLFDGPRGAAFRESWLRSIYQHCHFIHWHYSKFSSANNHLIGEAAGVYLTTRTWPLWQSFSGWGSVAKSILIDESVKQNTSDGVNREQAFSYQQFVLDFLLISGFAGKQTDDHFSDKYWANIEQMMVFIASVMDSGGHVPMVGDADDGYVTILDYTDAFDPYKSLLTTGAILFGRADFRDKAGALDNKTICLLGDDLCATYRAIKPKPENISSLRRVFDQGGYYILGHNFDSIEDECKILVDVGPLGYLSIAAHGHADALSFCMSIGGDEIFIDPGTFSYHTEKKWRDYFRGTSAHNTVRVDDQDQSEIGGNFMWLKKANASVLKWESNDDKDYIAASHDGYTRLSDPLIHRREYLLDKINRMLTITDHFECKRAHQVDRFWHLPPETVTEFNESSVSISVQNRKLSITDYSDTDTIAEIIEGLDSDDEILGWYSERFDVKRSSPTIRMRDHIYGNTTLFATISY